MVKKKPSSLTSGVPVEAREMTSPSKRAQPNPIWEGNTEMALCCVIGQTGTGPGLCIEKILYL